MTEITGFSFDASEELQVAFRFDGVGLAAKKMQAVSLLGQLESLLGSSKSWQEQGALISDTPATLAGSGRPTHAEPAVQNMTTGTVGNGAATAAVPAQLPRHYTYASPIGELDMIAHPSGFFTAQYGMLRATAKSEEEVVLELIGKVQASKQPAVATAAEPQAPVPGLSPTSVDATSKPATAPPPDLMAAQSFTQVLKWFVAHGVTSPEAIEQKCTEWRTTVPTLTRMTGDLGERIKRGMTVLQG